MNFRKFVISVLVALSVLSAFASSILIPMDESQKNHLKSYGITFWTLKRGIEVKWLLNYRGGSFMMQYVKNIEDECRIRGVSYEVIADGQALQIINEISSPSQNMEVIPMQKAPKIAVYTPPTKQPWDDAVTMVLAYAEITYDKLYDVEILNGELSKYDWLHLHHEDFTGQYGKFFGAYRAAPWYIEQKKEAEILAKKLGYNKVSEAE